MRTIQRRYRFHRLQADPEAGSGKKNRGGDGAVFVEGEQTLHDPGEERTHIPLLGAVLPFEEGPHRTRLPARRRDRVEQRGRVGAGVKAVAKAGELLAREAAKVGDPVERRGRTEPEGAQNAVDASQNRFDPAVRKRRTDPGRDLPILGTFVGGGRTNGIRLFRSRSIGKGEPIEAGGELEIPRGEV